VKGKYETTIDRESAYEMLGKRVAREAAPADGDQPGAGGGIGDWIGSIFGTNRKRGETLTAGQQIARTVTTTVIGGVAAAIGKQIGGRTGASIGRSIGRNTMGGILRR
jgi:hypothetical protein